MNNSHSVLLLKDGTVKSIGINTHGQLGNGNTVNQSTFQNLDITNVKQVSCGSAYTMFLLNDGTVKSVGSNYYGQLGNGNTVNQSTLQDAQISNVKRITCGSEHTMFLLNDGTVKSVGTNSRGQLGNGNKTDSSTIQTVPISNVKQIACGGEHTVFLLNDGTVKSVGSNYYGQLGNGGAVGSYSDATVLQDVQITNVKKIACGYNHTMFLLNDGTVKSVGLNDYGQLGNGTNTSGSNATATLQNVSLSNVSEIVCGNYYTMFLLNDGTVKSVGLNAHGELGNGTYVGWVATPTLQDVQITNVKQISCGDYHTMFLLNDGTARGVGANYYGQLGNGATSTETPTLQDVVISNVKLLWNNYIDILNKTLILHDGAYKKWIEGNSEHLSTMVIPLMTSNTTPSGVVSASSIYGLPSDAYKAFDDTTNGTWLSSINKTSGWLSYEFSDAKRITRYSLVPQQNAPNRSPKDWTFEGSNDIFVNDVNILHTQTNVTDWVSDVYKDFSFPNENSYTSYRIRIIENNGGNYTAIGEMKMWTPYVPATSSHWQTVSSTLPTSEQFISDGMDSLSPLLDRKVTTLEPITMTNKSEILQGGEGKVFSKKISLKKYIDLRNINVEVK